MDQVQNMELSKDQIIQELIALLNQNQQKEAANDVFEMATLIDGMGKRLEQVTEELSSVRKQLEKMEQEKADKTLKATVRKAVESLEQQCQKMKEQLFEIKTEVKAKASEIVAEAKAKGKAALLFRKGKEDNCGLPRGWLKESAYGQSYEGRDSGFSRRNSEARRDGTRPQEEKRRYHYFLTKIQAQKIPQTQMGDVLIGEITIT